MLARGRTESTYLPPDDVGLIVGGVVIIAAVLGSFAALLGLAALDVWSAVILVLLLGLLSLPGFRWVARTEGEPWLGRVLVWGFIAKMSMAMVRLFVFNVVYDGNGDAGVYHQAGATFARRFRDGEPIHPLPVISAFPRESQWIGDMVGGLYTVTSPSQYAGFLGFAYLCFIGQVLLLRGAYQAIPELDRRRAAHLVLFLPSLLFWPSAIGKEAVMLFCLGIVAYGGGLLLSPRPRLRGIPYFAAGAGLAALIRPHVALMSVVALGVATALGAIVGNRGGGVGSGRSRAIRIVALLGLGVIALAATDLVSQRFDAEAERGSGSALETTLTMTSLGGSEFAPVTIAGIRDLPLGVLSVVFRPLPWEVGNVNGLIAAAEGLFLVTLVALSWRRILRAASIYLKRPFLAFATVFVLIFSTGFSYVANFGILARQRTQMMPMVLVLLAVAAPATRGPRARARQGESLAAGAEPDDPGTVEEVAARATLVRTSRGGERW